MADADPALAIEQSADQVFHVILIKPTHYDDEGYPIQFQKSAMPSNTLACLYALTEDARERRILGEVEIRALAIDESNQRASPDRIIEKLAKSGQRAMVALVGVQSPQFCRAVDLARPFCEAGIPVCMGGFHVSGTLAMLPEMTPELREAQEMGISFFAGEAEDGRLDEVLRDAWQGTLKPIYNYMKDLPGIAGEPMPVLPQSVLDRVYATMSCFDLGRGCPFQCSFCTIINVHGRKSRFRSPDDVERLLRRSHENGTRTFFITDDNFSRNQHWESLIDRVIALREEGLEFSFIIQVDTLCHRIPNFIEKMARAGVKRAFIGLENINPDNLLEVKKRQNKISEYRDMLQEWRKYGVVTYAGYILGFPNDTKESILHDIEIIKRELPLDVLEFFYLTPLPGSEDHRTMLQKGMWMDPDLNKYDLTHRVTHHPKMSDEEWDSAYAEAWRHYYSPDHVRALARRAAATPGYPVDELRHLILIFSMSFDIEGMHPLETGTWRMYFREDRRHGMPIEDAETFAGRIRDEGDGKAERYGAAKRVVDKIFEEVLSDPDRASYRDVATAPQFEEEFDTLAIYKETRGADAAMARQRPRRAVLPSVATLPAA